MSISFLLRGSVRTSTEAPKSITKASTRTWSTMLSTMLRADRAPDSLIVRRPISTVVTKAATSIGRDKFDLQTLDARVREIEDAQNPLVVQAVVSRQKQHALFRGPAAQDLRHARRQFGRRDLLIGQGHVTVRRKPLRFRGPEDAAGRGRDAQDHSQVLSLRGRGIGRVSRDVDVIALHEERNDDHEDDQQHEHHVDERREVDLGLQTGSGTAPLELHDFTLPPPLRPGPWPSAPPPGSRPARLPACPPAPEGRS